MSFTVLQVSDTHLGPGTTLFRANFDRVVALCASLAPDLVVTSGDVSLDGADREADLAFAATQFARLGRVHAVPGNHDVGDHPDIAPRQTVDTGRLERFRSHFGPDRWVLDHDGWRLLGLNSQIMGAHMEEQAQAAMIADALATLGTRRLAVFIHKPLFLSDPADPTFDYWSVPPIARGPLLPLIAHPALRIVSCGHLHLHHQAMRGPVSYVRAPSTAFIVDPAEQAGLEGDRPCGVLLHRFDADTVETLLLTPSGMDRPFIHDVRAEAYPG